RCYGAIHSFPTRRSSDLATLADVLIPGEDEESDEALYQRYLEEINATRYGGNVDQYREWISAIPGVGRFKVQPLWNGRGTVRAIDRKSTRLNSSHVKISY